MNCICRTASVAVTAVMILMGVMLSACHPQPDYPALLVEADSAFVRGDYTTADSLLTTYDRQPEESEAASMYRKLLECEYYYTEYNIPPEYTYTLDSLCNYYNTDKQSSKYVRALLFMGNACNSNEDYPQALRYCLQAEKQAIEQDDQLLLHWVNIEIGDIYFTQGMYDECIPYYQKGYTCALRKKDQLRSAYAALRMGLLFTIKNEVDSTIHYYQKAIELGSSLPKESDIVTSAQAKLCDIYTQIEEFDKALSLLSREKTHNLLWAYWHYGQNHIDSAITYLKLSLDQYDMKVRVECLRMLAPLEEERGNTLQSLHYYKMLQSVEDSLSRVSQKEMTRKIHAQFNYNHVRQERNEIAIHSHKLERILMIVGTGALLLIIGVALLWQYYIRKNRQRVEREKQLLREKNHQYQQSLQTLEENKRRIDVLTQLLVEAQQKDDDDTASKIRQETELLDLQNQGIVNNKRRRELMLQELKASAIFKKIMRHEKLTVEETQTLIDAIDDIYDRFTSRLLMLSRLSDLEIQICCLVKIGIAPSDMAAILCKSKSAVTQSRTRMYQKLTGRKGTSKLFDEFIYAF